MSRNAAAAELQRLIGELQALCTRAERLADASGGLVDPKYFRAAMLHAVYAAGDLHSKGLLVADAEQVR